jgi:hypothetical protein
MIWSGERAHRYKAERGEESEGLLTGRHLTSSRAANSSNSSNVRYGEAI